MSKRCEKWFFFAEYNEESNEKDPKFKADDHVRISKCEIIFAKGYAPNWNEDVFVGKKNMWLLI